MEDIYKFRAFKLLKWYAINSSNLTGKKVKKCYNLISTLLYKSGQKNVSVSIEFPSGISMITNKTPIISINYTP